MLFVNASVDIDPNLSKGNHSLKRIYLPLNDGWRMGTPLKFDLEPENGPLEKEIPFNNYHFPVLCLTLGVYLLSIA